MAKRLQVDTDGLEGDGNDLAQLGSKIDEEDCRQPASDPASTTGAMAFTQYDQGLVQRLNEAREVREHGGAIVKASAVLFEVADEQGALMIDRVDVLGSPRADSAGPPSIDVPAQPKSFATPRIDSVIPSAGMGAEAFSEAIHSGAGGEVVRDFSRHWTTAADDVDVLGDRATAIADQIQAHWQDADSNAAPNVRNHGTWLHDASDFAVKLAKGADDFASAFDVAKNETPTPEALSAAKCATMASVITGPGAVVALAVYMNMKADADEAAAKYSTAVDKAVRGVGDPVGKPSLIAKRAAIPDELVKGPGQWVEESRGDREDWKKYEQQVTGYPAGMEYEVDMPDGDSVEFDGYDPDAGDNGLYIEAKGKGYEWMVADNGQFDPRWRVNEQISNELQGQYEASLETGVPVEWRVADPRTAGAIQAIVDRDGYGDRITVITVPPA
ncbi:MAG: Tox-REase-5 domain-containing protein [Mycobacterium sp.]